MRRAGTLLLLLVLAACGGKAPPPPPAPLGTPTDFGPNPQAVTLTGAAASVRPPPGTWRVRTGSPAKGETFEEYRRDEVGALLRVLVFPVLRQRSPAAVLPRAIDIFVRGQGTQGFGMTARGAGLVLGAPAAWASYAAVVHGTTVAGRARLLLVGRDTWALAIGHAPRERVDVVRTLAASADSLEPLEPVFYARSFAAALDLDKPVTHAAGEEPVRLRDVVALQLVLEAGLGVRMPLAARPAMLAALSEEVRRGPAQGRKTFRSYPAMLARTQGMEPAARAKGLHALGQKILAALRKRVPGGHPPAVAWDLARSRMQKVVVGKGPDGLDQGALTCLLEMSAFLASLAADREVPVTADRGRALREDLAERWKDLPADERAALRDLGRAWAALRYAWDEAAPARRLALRRAALARLVPASQRAEVAALHDARDLLRWMQAHAQAGAQGYLVAAEHLGRADRRALLDVLGVEAAGYHLGW
jgi:hypothetical protein